jgi:hypothetical protein
MKLHAAGRSAIVRGIAIGAVPVAAVAALIGPAAGAAQAMRTDPVNCQALFAQADRAWDYSHTYDYEADQAWDDNDIVNYVADTVAAKYYEEKGDSVYADYVSAGC